MLFCTWVIVARDSKWGVDFSHSKNITSKFHKTVVMFGQNPDPDVSVQWLIFPSRDQHTVVKIPHSFWYSVHKATSCDKNFHPGARKAIRYFYM